MRACPTSWTTLGRAGAARACAASLRRTCLCTARMRPPPGAPHAEMAPALLLTCIEVSVKSIMLHGE